WPQCRNGRRRTPQRLRPLLQSRRRVIHLRFGHGMGRRRAVVSADAARSRRARRRIRLAQRLVEMADVLSRQPAADPGDWPRLAGIGRAVRQPQFNSAFARDAIANVQDEMKQEWDRQLTNLVKDPEAKATDRERGIELMHLYGPFPSPSLLVQLSKDKSAEI